MNDGPESTPDPAGTPAPEPAPVARLQVPPWVQLVGLPLIVLFGYLFVKAASHAVVVFLIAGLISLLLAPVVRSLSTSGVPRLLSVFIVFGAFASLVVVVTIGLVDLLAEQAADVRRNADDIGAAAVRLIDSMQEFANRRGWDVDLRDQGVRFVEQLQERSTELSGEALELGRHFVTFVAEAAFKLVLIVVITIYMLLDAPRISRLFVSLLPANSGAETLIGRLERSLLRYTVGQTLASLVMGTSAAIGLWVMGKVGIWEAADEYAVLFGLIVAVTEFAPSIGPAIGSIPPIITALVDGIGPAIAVALFYLLLHQIEGHIVIPKLMGAAIAVHPLLVIFGIIAGAQIMGVGGILLALPLLAVSREIVVFIRERVVLGAWPGPIPATMLATPDGGAQQPRGPAGPRAPSESAGSQPLGTRMRAMLERRRARRARRGDDGSEPGEDA